MPGPALGVDPSESADGRVWALTFEHSPVGMALVALDGSWLQVNQSLCQMLGYPAARLMGMTFQDITHPDDLEQDLDLLRACLAGERADYRMVKRYLHADGRLVWGDLSVALVRDDLGRPRHFISQILDVSEHRADRARLEMVMHDLTTANSDLEQFAAVVSHDLKTPLAAVKASLEILVDDLAHWSPDAGTRVDAGANGPLALATRAEAATERMAALIDALLAYTTTDPRLRGSDGWNSGAAATPLREIVEAALADVHMLVERCGARVEIDPHLAQAPPVLASPALVRTLLVNLVGNAVKHRDPARPLGVCIGAEIDPDDAHLVRVTVGNDGPSIPVEQRDQLFSLFSRGPHTDDQTTRVPGFGIGLAACRRIASWHGGQIWFAEPDSGSGVVVHVTLPRAPGPHH